jgi:hypothetical protein
MIIKRNWHDTHPTIAHQYDMHILAQMTMFYNAALGTTHGNILIILL